ncbi:cell envelope integrity protein TolA [Providencia stuartii]|uniref:cell envelope integrity protein TolA n=1 Tax=Providencia stuartii TaxID=588 RepID=UPI0034E4BC2A
MYNVGTVTTTANSTKLVGVGTKWKDNNSRVSAEQVILIQNGATIYINSIASIQSNTEITLSFPVPASVSNAPYQILTTMVNSVSDAANKIVAMNVSNVQFSDILNRWATESGTITVTLPDGTTQQLRTAKEMDKQLDGKQVAGNYADGTKYTTTSYQCSIRPNEIYGLIIQNSGVSGMWSNEANSWLWSFSTKGTLVAGNIPYDRLTGVTTDNNGFVKKASPIVKLFADHIELNEESEGVEMEHLGVGHYLIKGVVGFNSDGAWGINNGFVIPQDHNGKNMVLIDYKVRPDGDIEVFVFHQQNTDLPERFQNKRIKYIDKDGNPVYYENYEPCDVPESRWIDMRVEMPVNSIYNLKQAEAERLAKEEADRQAEEEAKNAEIEAEEDI